MKDLLKSKKFIYALLAVNIVFLGVNIFLILNDSESQADDTKAQQQEYPFLSKRIFSENQNDIIIHFNPLRGVLHEYLEAQNDSAHTSVYFEYLSSGSSIGINENLRSNIASLVKLPTVMAIYKKVEDGQLLLDQKVAIEKSDLDSSFGDLWQMGENTTLTIQELIDYTLVESDNTAHKVLRRQLTGTDVANVLQEINIEVDAKDGHLEMSPKSYSSILRSLYLSSYLQRENSQKILETLTRTVFNDRIRAGVPEEVPVAHKIGVFNSKNEGINQEVYSDCGIVYEPNRPYILCIMVHGESLEKARDNMKNISQLIYGYVSQVK